jgi:RNA polymerase sigma-70 factor (ECF subfamily)
MDGPSDEELVQRYRAAGGPPRGDPFLNQLFHRYHPRVAAWCVRMTGDPNSAADLAQEVFVKAFRHLDSFRGDSKFTTWLYSIARNRCMDELRSKTARLEETPDTGLEDVADERSQSVLVSMLRHESAEIVRGLIRDSLDETEMQAVTLHYVHELPLEAVTRILGLQNQSGAKAYIVSARRKLVKAFARLQSRQQGLKGGANV